MLLAGLRFRWFIVVLAVALPHGAAAQDLSAPSANGLVIKKPDLGQLGNIQLASPLPELDAFAQAEGSWLTAATAAQVNAKMAAGHRLIRLGLASPTSMTFDALFVKNAGVFKDDTAAWHADLSQEQLLTKNTATARVTDLSPYIKDGVVRFLAVTASNKGAKSLETKLLLGVGLGEVKAAIQGGDWRVIDLEQITTSLPSGGGPFSPVNFVSKYYAVAVKNSGGAKREQKIGEGTEQEINAALMGPLPAGGLLKRDWRVSSIQPAGGMSTNLYVYVAERMLPGEWAWWKPNLRIGDPLHPTSDPAHVVRRLGARLVDLRRIGGSGARPQFLGVLVAERALPLTGALTRPEAFAEADRLLELTARGNELPGLSVAVVRDGKLVYARSMGYADVDAQVPLEPTDLLRIASVSKSITGLATLRLMEEKPTLTSTSQPFKEYYTATAGKGVDADKIRLQDLLNHRTGLRCGFGWTGYVSDVLNYESTKDTSCCPSTDGSPRKDCGDATLKPCECAGGKSVLREWTEGGVLHPVQPGEFHTYYNGNYYLLGDLFAGILGQQVSSVPGYPQPISKLHEFVQARFLKPLGLRRMAPSGSLPGGERESHYYVPVGFVPPKGATPELMVDYTAWSHDGPARLGGTSWAASMVDLVRLVCSADGTCAGPRVVNSKSWAKIYERPLSEPNLTDFYGQGFAVQLECTKQPQLGRPGGTGSTLPTSGFSLCKPKSLSHGGYLPGTTGAALVWMGSGVTIAYAMNSDLASNSGFQNPWDYLSGPLEKAILAADVSGIDLFPNYTKATTVALFPPRVRHMPRVPVPDEVLQTPLDARRELLMNQAK